MYYPYFLTYIIAGLILSLAVFGWALKNGQFREQERARFLPLEDEPAARSPGMSRVRRMEFLALSALVVIGLVLSAAVLLFSLIQKGPLP